MPHSTHASVLPSSVGALGSLCRGGVGVRCVWGGGDSVQPQPAYLPMHPTSMT